MPLNTTKQELSKPLRCSIAFPHIEPIVTLVSRHFRAQERKPNLAILRDALLSFFEHEMENVRVYSPREPGVSFPWTVVHVADLAQTLYAKYAPGHSVVGTNPKMPDIRVKTEFVFPSFQFVDHGNHFTFVEEAMHKTIKYLPRAFQAIARGRKPERHSIYTFGAPTGEIGTLSADFVDKLADDKAFAEFALLYAPLIESLLPKELIDNNSRTSVLLYGASMGANFAVETAKQLLRNRSVVQSVEKVPGDRLPLLHVRIDTAPGLNGPLGKLRSWQILVGFLATSVFAMTTDRYLRKVMVGNRRFMSAVNTALLGEGISIHVEPEQLRLKRRAIACVTEALRRGVALPEDLKVIEVAGLCDPLSFPRKDLSHLTQQRRAHPWSLGRSLTATRKNRRTFVATMGHSIPFFRSNELTRLGNVALQLESLRNRIKTAPG